MMTKKRPKINKTKWSEKNRYKHIHTGEHCTFEAYLAEKLILRWTEAFKMDKPSYKFWTAGDRYHESFMRNMKAAKGLSKKFPESIILEAIDSPFFEKIISSPCSFAKDLPKEFAKMISAFLFVLGTILLLKMKVIYDINIDRINPGKISL